VRVSTLRVVCEPPDRKHGKNLLLLVEEMNGGHQALIQVVNYLVAKGNRSYLKKSFAAQRKCTYQVKPLCRWAGHSPSRWLNQERSSL